LQTEIVLYKRKRHIKTHVDGYSKFIFTDALSVVVWHSWHSVVDRIDELINRLVFGWVTIPVCN